MQRNHAIGGAHRWKEFVACGPHHEPEASEGHNGPGPLLQIARGPKILRSTSSPESAGSSPSEGNRLRPAVISSGDGWAGALVMGHTDLEPRSPPTPNP